MSLSSSLRSEGVEKYSSCEKLTPDGTRIQHRDSTPSDSTDLQQQIKRLNQQLAAEAAGRQDAIAAQTLAEQRAEESVKEAAYVQRMAEEQVAFHTSESRATQVRLASQAAQITDLCAENQTLDRQLAVLKAQVRDLHQELDHSHQAAVQHMDGQLETLRRQHAEAMEGLAGECHQEMVKRQALALEIKDLRQQRKTKEAQELPPAVTSCSESRLRAALTQTGASTEELRSAILAVESLTSEARRELSNRQLRERRAAFEQLHAALAREDEQALIEAIEEARRAGVDTEDIEKATASLRELQELTTEERAAKAAREQLARSKERAFLLVKRDDLAALREHLSAVEDAGMQWKPWKDHARRTLLQCATQLRAAKVREWLEVAAGSPATQQSPGSSVKKWRPDDSARAPAAAPVRQAAKVVAAPAVAVVGKSPPSHSRGLAEAKLCEAADAELQLSLGETSPAPETTPEAPEIESLAIDLSEEEEAELRTKAFRAVVKDDTSTLAEVISERVPLAMWKRWQNKGGKDLLTLSEERGSKAAYSMLAKALGLLKERKRESYEEREAVWVLFGGDVQPRRATVLEDTAEEADEVFLEFWDGDEPPSRVGRDFVLKAAC